MTYAKQFRGQASYLARQRTTAVDWVSFLSEEDDVTKKNFLRELGHTSLTKQPTKKQPPPKREPPTRTYDKGGDKGGRGPKGKKKGGKGRDRGKTNNWTRADWDAYRAPQAQLASHGTLPATTAPGPPAVAPKKGDEK